MNGATGMHPDYLKDPVLTGIIRVLWGIVILSVLFAGMIFFLPLERYQSLGHLFEAAVAIFCMVCCLYAYRTISGHVVLLLGAFAFFGYAISTVFWYFYSVALGRTFAYTTVAELSFYCFFLFFVAAITIEFPRHEMPLAYSLFLLALFLSIPLIIITGNVISQPLRLALILFRFLLIEQLIDVAIRHRVYICPVLWAGICFRCIGAMVYGIRETVLLNSPVILIPATSLTPPVSAYDFLSIVGPMNICSFALIQIGLILYIVKTGPREEKRETILS
jgi:hypothetical protein